MAGPFLFSVYIRYTYSNEIIDDELIKARDLESLLSRVDRAIYKFKDCFSRNNFKLNEHKTKSIVFTTTKCNFDVPEEVLVGDQVLPCCTEAKILGCILDGSLSFEGDIETLIYMLSSVLYSFRVLINKIKAPWK